MPTAAPAAPAADADVVTESAAVPETTVCDVGLIGLGVMGQNLALNMADHGYRVAVYNRTGDITDRFLADHPPDTFRGDRKPEQETTGARRRSGRIGGLVNCQTVESLIEATKSPRIIIVMVKAGKPVDAVCEALIEAGIEPEDIVVDGGNSLWTDTIEREKTYRGQLIFFGSGVSGGEEGARFGPSLMPGGDPAAWRRLRPIWEAIAAKVDPKTGKPIEGATPGNPIVAPDAEPCTAYIGPDGAGHYVKMVHNGIEYADMQLIGEAYFLMRSLLKMSPPEMADVFEKWNRGDLDSFLIEITADILRQVDPASIAAPDAKSGRRTSKPKSKSKSKPRYLIDVVLDAAGQKGTGKWTSANALDMGVPAVTITEAVFARVISALKERRVEANRVLKGPKWGAGGPARVAKAKFVTMIRDALYCSKICAYAQGFELMAAAQGEYNWRLNFGEIAMIWRGGCIIRARFLQKIKEAFDEQPKLANLMLDPYFRRKLAAGQASWRKVVSLAAEAGVPCPCFMSALSYYDSYRSAALPANLLQAQRDYFGAHTFERTDAPRGRFFHVDWPAPRESRRQVQM